MTSDSDVDLLIATLHPHVFKRLFNDKLLPAYSLEPSEGTAEFRKLVQAFATLFSFHPGCDAAAVTAQACQSGNTLLHICLSPSTPNEFDIHVDQWLTQFMALRQESKSFGGVRRRDTFSQSEKRFILDTYRLCYPVMSQRTVSQALGDWKVFANAPEPETDMFALEPTEEEKRLRREYGDRLQRLSKLIQTFVTIISGETAPQDEDMLNFHELCLTIRDVMKSDGFVDFLEEYVYPGGVDPTLEYLCLPVELSTLLDQSRSPNLAFDGKWSSHVLDPSAGARQFSVVVTKTDLVERFGEVPGINWENVVRAFEDFAAKPMDDGRGYEWNAHQKRLSTRGPVTVHPEITLIQHLLEKGDRGAEAYMACSRTPCYASVLYAGAVNQTLKTRFTMRADHPDWCRLHTAEPWILPKVTTPEVVAGMKEELLRDLKKLMRQWVWERARGYRGSATK